MAQRRKRLIAWGRRTIVRGKHAVEHWERWVDSFRHWRWERTHPERLSELRNYRTPIQVCPRGCEHHEAAREDVLTRTALWGRVEMRVVPTFETKKCPKCGTLLVRKCARCEGEIFAPLDRCQFCGRPQPWAAERRVAAERASVRAWRPGVKGVRDSARELYDAGDERELWVVDGDLTRLALDAVVSNVDVYGQMWADGASAIRNAAGEEVERRAQDEKPYKLGEAWVTTAGNMNPPVKKVIHVASMNRRGESSLEVVRDCLESALAQALDKGLKSVGIGAFGSGPDAIDLNDWLKAFADTTVPYLLGTSSSENDKNPLAVLLVLFEPEDFESHYRLLVEAVNKKHKELREPARGKPVSRAV